MFNPTPSEIREARIYAGLTQEQAARLVHVTRGAWAFWESGKRRMSTALWELFLSKTYNLLYVFEHRRGIIFKFAKMSTGEFERTYNLGMPYSDWVDAGKCLDDVYETADLESAREFFADYETDNETADEIRKELGLQ